MSPRLSGAKAWYKIIVFSSGASFDGHAFFQLFSRSTGPSSGAAAGWRLTRPGIYRTVVGRAGVPVVRAAQTSDEEDEKVSVGFCDRRCCFVLYCCVLYSTALAAFDVLWGEMISARAGHPLLVQCVAISSCPVVICFPAIAHRKYTPLYRAVSFVW